LTNAVGNTPLVEIVYEYKNKIRTIYAKLEYYNFSGSIKDRMALHILKKAKASGKLKAGNRIVEATSGNTGIAFCALGAALGYPVTIFMPDWMSDERKNLIRSFGADIVLVTKEQGGFLGSINRVEEFSECTPWTFLPRQFANEDNCEAHEQSTGPEIWEQMRSQGLKVDAFVAGVGTGGTIMGVGNFLRKKDSSIRIHPLEPSNSPTMSTGVKDGKHRIQGISDEFIPSIVKLEKLDRIVDVDDGDSIIMAQQLSHVLGLGVGISSGANFLGAAKVLEDNNGKINVVTVFSDDNKKYLTTDLMKVETIKDGFLSAEIKLLDMHIIDRLCKHCGYSVKD
jgi:cysteine synthase A